jgi:GNAT superfamily N-acetyltransferase
MSRPAVFMRALAEAVASRPAQDEDIAALNGVIARAVMSWNLPERVKRLSLPSYRYQPHDLGHLHLVVAEDAAHEIVGVAAWEEANPRDTPAGKRGLLLHGLYVDPANQHQGIGSRLLDAALAAAREGGYDGLLVKAQADANGFFAARGLMRLPVENPERDYPHRYWQASSNHC